MIANTAAKSSAATSRPVTDQAEQRAHDAIRAASTPIDCGAWLMSSQGPPSIDVTWPRLLGDQPCGRDVPRGQAALLDEGVEAAIRDI